MPGYDFDRVIPRRNTGCFKYDGLLAAFGRADLQPLSVADMDFRSPECVGEALQRLVDHGIYGYPVQSDASATAVAAWFERRHRYHVDPGAVIFTPGVIAAITCVLQALTAPGDAIIIQPPVYHPFFTIVPGSGRALLQNRLREEAGRYTIDYDDLEARSRQAKVLLFCSPHNPVGRVWRREELERVAEICLRNGLLIIADEIHNDLVYPPHAHVPIASLSPEVERITITCHAASKTFNLPGLFTAYAIVPDRALRRTLKQFLAPLHIESVNVFGLQALRAAYAEGEPWLAALLPYLAENYQALRAQLANSAPLVRLSPMEGTYLAWLDFRKYGLTPDALKARVRDEARLALNDGQIFGPGGEGFQRVNLACPRLVLVEAIQRLRPAFGEA